MTVNATLGAQSVPEDMPDERQHRRIMARALRGILRGKVNVTLDATLTANAATTTLNDARIGYDSAIIPAMPMTANGAACLAAGIYVDTVTAPVGTTPPSAIVHHRNNAAVDQTIRFVIIG